MRKSLNSRMNLSRKNQNNQLNLHRKDLKRMTLVIKRTILIKRNLLKKIMNKIYL
ncbi:MAG: hypothetical protein WAQ88_05320 [Caldicoprobacterales bacterium]